MPSPSARPPDPRSGIAADARCVRTAVKWVHLQLPPSPTGHPLTLAMGTAFLLRPLTSLRVSAALLRPAGPGLARQVTSWSAGAAEEDEEDIMEARKWLKSFTADSIPKEFYETSYSRSSGPGTCLKTSTREMDSGKARTMRSGSRVHKVKIYAMF